MTVRETANCTGRSCPRKVNLGTLFSLDYQEILRTGYLETSASKKTEFALLLKVQESLREMPSSPATAGGAGGGGRRDSDGKDKTRLKNSLKSADFSCPGFIRCRGNYQKLARFFRRPKKCIFCRRLQNCWVTSARKSSGSNSPRGDYKSLLAVWKLRETPAFKSQLAGSGKLRQLSCSAL